jgi:hypothetical protein
VVGNVIVENMTVTNNTTTKNLAVSAMTNFTDLAVTGTLSLPNESVTRAILAEGSVTFSSVGATLVSDGSGPTFAVKLKIWNVSLRRKGQHHSSEFETNICVLDFYFQV